MKLPKKFASLNLKLKAELLRNFYYFKLLFVGYKA